MKTLSAALAVVMLTSIVGADSNPWIWNKEMDSHVISRRTTDDENKNETLNDSQGRQLFSEQEILSDDATLDEIIESILHRSREGRNVDEYSEICTDPNVQEALEKGDNTQARNLIKEKLCSLGLMQCDIEGKQPFRLRGSNTYRPPYGPPRPMLHRPSLNMVPPRKIGYEGSVASKPYLNGAPDFIYNGPLRPTYTAPPGSVYNGPYLDSPPPSLTGSTATFSKPPPGAIIYGSKPPGPIYEGVDAPYDFEHIGEKIQVEHGQVSFDHQLSPQGGITGKPTIVVNAQGGAASTSNSPGQSASTQTLQQHVHHHFHHIDGSTGKPLSASVSLASGNNVGNTFAGIASHIGSVSPLSPGYDLKNEISHTSAVTSGFNGSPGLAGVSASNGHGLILGSTISGLEGNIGGGDETVNALYGNVKPISEVSQAIYGSGFTNALGSSGTSFGNTPLGISGVYNSNTNVDYLKKYIQGNRGSNLYGYDQENKFLSQSNQYGNQFSKYTGVDDYNAVETSRQHIIDCVCVPYSQCPAADRIARKEDLILPIDPRNLGSDIEALTEESKNVTSEKKPNEEEKKKISKREAPEKEISGQSEEAASDIEPRLTISNSFPQTTVNFQKRKVLPTFGVSFGLPYPSGTYPVNSFGSYPAQNPYFGAINPNGLNLGLVNVNPLLSLQVTKTEHGEKVVKPLINLHVTPNEQLIHKVGSLLKTKKDFILNQHEHLHHHSHYDSSPEMYFLHPPHPPPYIHHGPIHDFSFPRPIHDSLDMSIAGGFYGFDYPISSSLNRPDIEPTMYDFIPHSLYERSYNISNSENRYALNFDDDRSYRQEKQFRFDGSSNLLRTIPTRTPGHEPGSNYITFPKNRRRRSLGKKEPVEQQFGNTKNYLKEKRQAFYGGHAQECNTGFVCCRRPSRVQQKQLGRCGTRNAHGITGRIKTPVYVDGDSEFGEYPWQVAILKKDPKESVYVCGGTIIDHLHVITAAHCVKTFGGFDLRVRLGEWDVNHDVEFFPYIERDVVSVHVHPEYYAGTLDNDLALLKLDHPTDFIKNPHISPACLPDKYADFTGARCWTTGWGKDAFGEFGKYQNILKEVDVPIISHQQCENQLRHTRLGYGFKLHPGFVCAGGEEGKDACKGDGGGPMVCEKNGIWQLVGVVSWGIGCGQVNVPGVYARVSYYLDWIHQIIRN